MLRGINHLKVYHYVKDQSSCLGIIIWIRVYHHVKGRATKETPFRGMLGGQPNHDRQLCFPL